MGCLILRPDWVPDGLGVVADQQGVEMWVLRILSIIACSYGVAVVAGTGTALALAVTSNGYDVALVSRLGPAIALTSSVVFLPFVIGVFLLNLLFHNSVNSYLMSWCVSGFAVFIVLVTLTLWSKLWSNAGFAALAAIACGAMAFFGVFALLNRIFNLTATTI